MKHNTKNYLGLSVVLGLFSVVFGFMMAGCHSQAPACTISAPPCVSSSDAGTDSSSDAAMNSKKELSMAEYAEILDACTEDCIEETSENAFCSCICSAVVTKIRTHHPETLEKVIEILPAVRPSQKEKMECKQASATKI